MEDPNNERANNEGAAQSPQTARNERQRQMRDSLQKMQALKQAMSQYEPYTREQINRQFYDFNPPFYARIRGIGKGEYIRHAQLTVVGLAAGAQRHLTDSEAQAISEKTISRLNNFGLFRWAMTGAAVYFAWRGRATYRFPFRQPLYNGRFNPYGASPLKQRLWHLGRFAAYYGVLWIMVEPLYMALEGSRMLSFIKTDDRLRGVVNNVRAKDHDQEGNGQLHSYSSSVQSNENNGFESQQEPARVPATPTSWDEASASRNSAGSGAWDTASDVDDGSPIASTSWDEPKSAARSRGSSWDRLRDQSMSQSNRSAQRGRGATNSGRIAEGPDRERVTYSQSEEDQNARAKDQAQKEFDALLDQERRGTNQERENWGKK